MSTPFPSEDLTSDRPFFSEVRVELDAEAGGRVTREHLADANVAAARPTSTFASRRRCEIRPFDGHPRATAIGFPCQKRMKTARSIQLRLDNAVMP
jgi:hypothetical protein